MTDARHFMSAVPRASLLAAAAAADTTAVISTRVMMNVSHDNSRHPSFAVAYHVLRT